MKRYDIFIAYRRAETAEEAEIIHDELIRRGYSAFLDLKDGQGGNYKSDFREIAQACLNYIVIVTDTSFKRCKTDHNDFFGAGIKFALESGKRIIPVFARGCHDFPDDLPVEIAKIADQNGSYYNHIDFDSFIDDLISRFLVDNTKVSVSNPETDFLIEEDVLIEYLGTATIVRIPENIAVIGNQAFKDKTKVTKIILPDCLREIGEGAFERCISIQNIIIPDSVEIIRDDAFSRCYNLGYVRLGKNLHRLGERALAFCCNLKFIEISMNVNEVFGSTFNGCSMLKSIYVDEANSYFKSVDGLLYDYKMKTFIRCPEAYEHDCIDVKDGVESIDQYAFFRCLDISQINLPRSVKNIKEHAFEGCCNITNLVLHENIKNVELSAFENWKLAQIGFSRAFSPVLKRSIEKHLEHSHSDDNALLNCKYVYIVTTFESIEEARKMANMLVKNKFIASGQIKQIESTYWWENEINNEPEYELSCITTADNYEITKQFMNIYHSYAVCQILVYPIIDTSKEIGEWIENSLR